MQSLFSQTGKSSTSTEKVLNYLARVEDEFLIKHLRKQGTLIFLSPANPAYPPIILEENMSVEVWGPVVSVIRRLK